MPFIKVGTESAPESLPVYCRGRHTLWLHDSCKTQPLTIPAENEDKIIFGQGMTTGGGFTVIQIYVLAKDEPVPPGFDHP